MTIAPESSDEIDPHAAAVHAVLHCNLNSPDAAGAAAFWERFGFSRRMRNRSDDTDARFLGLGEHTASDTWFMYDARGPRAAPAIEICEWTDPPVELREPGEDSQAVGFTGLGVRVCSLGEETGDSAYVTEHPRHTAWVRGRLRQAQYVAAPDGVRVEVVEIDPVTPDEGPAFSHARLRCTDLGATVSWYSRLGWREVEPSEPRSDGVSLVVDEDPTFSLEIELDPDAVPSTMRANTQGVFRVALGCEDVPGAVELLRAAGVEAPDPVFTAMPDVPTGGFSVAVLHDPDATMVELVSRPRAEVRRPMEPAG
jgi:catechol 2,3-dioxygenase-like lactoylglutathione lyase family enzyme